MTRQEALKAVRDAIVFARTFNLTEEEKSAICGSVREDQTSKRATDALAGRTEPETPLAKPSDILAGKRGTR